MSFKQFLLESNNIISSYRIYLDMDGVLVDHSKGWKELTNNEEGTVEEYLQRYGYGEYNKLMDSAGKGFWTSLDWMPDGKDLWKYLKNKDTTICSTPSGGKNNITHSIEGKKQWLKEKLKLTGSVATSPQEYNGKQNIIISAQKELFIQTTPTTDSILIDDRDVVLNKWIAKGGTGVKHTSTKNTIKQLNKLGI